MNDPLHHIEQRLRAHDRRVTRRGDTLDAQCPAHDDRNPSLTVSRGTTQPVVLTCHAGCDTGHILGALGLTWADISTPTQPATTNEPTRYTYTDRDGHPLYRVNRTTDKRFWQQHLDPATGEWVNGRGPHQPTLYRLPEVLDGIARGDRIVIVEGEKDVHTLTRRGVVATCNVGGAGKFSDDMADLLTGAAQVTVIADNDEPGRAHAHHIGQLLTARNIPHTLHIPTVGNDITEQVGHGTNWDRLQPLPTHNDNTGTPPGVSPSFLPVDIGAVLTGTIEQPTPTILRRADGTALIYPGEVNLLFGDSGHGKGWLTLYAIHQQLVAGHNCMLIDAEDTAQSIVARLRIIGTPDDHIARHLTYIRPSDEFTTANVDHLCRIATEQHTTLVVIDSLGACFGLDGINEDKDNEVAPWLRRVSRKLADTGAAVINIDHITKANDNPMHSSGSKRKRADACAAYLVKATTPPTADTGGVITITTAKDRHGHHQTKHTVARLVITVDPLTGTTFTLHEPDSAGHGDLPVVLAARAAVRAGREHGTDITQNVLLSLMKITAATATKRAGIDLAVSRGALIESVGARNARVFTYAKDLPDDL